MSKSTIFATIDETISTTPSQNDLQLYEQLQSGLQLHMRFRLMPIVNLDKNGNEKYIYIIKFLWHF